MLGYILYCQGFIVAMKYNIGFYTSLLDNLNGLKFALKLSVGVSGVWWYFATLLFGIPHQCFSTDMSSLAVISLQYIYVFVPSPAGFCYSCLRYFLLSLICMSYIYIISVTLYNICIQHQWHISEKGAGT